MDFIKFEVRADRHVDEGFMKVALIDKTNDVILDCWTIIFPTDFKDFKADLDELFSN